MPCAADWTAMSRHRQILEPRGGREHSSAILVERHWESDDKIIAVAHQHRLASKARLHLALEPSVQCVMQVQVPQQRRET